MIKELIQFISYSSKMSELYFQWTKDSDASDSFNKLRDNLSQAVDDHLKNRENKSNSNFRAGFQCTREELQSALGDSRTVGCTMLPCESEVIKWQEAVNYLNRACVEFREGDAELGEELVRAADKCLGFVELAKIQEEN